ncbi:MAG: UvrD-helicase domain-containing protein [Dehalococcoidia bacterium]
MELTAEQRAIVEAGDIDIAVSAGAGSGKTHVLVERYVALLGRCTIPEIVAVTFTEAAAAEMRQRVRREVMTRVELHAHRPQVDDAIIGTIHGLCLRLLREYPVEAGLDPRAAVLAEDEAELLRGAAAVGAIDEAAEAGDDRTDLLRALGVYQASQMLPVMLQSRDDVAAAFAAMPADAESMVIDLRGRMEDAARVALDPLRAQVPAHLDDVLSLVLDPSDLLATKISAARAALGDPATGGTAEWAERLEAYTRAVNLVGGRKAAWAADLPDVKKRLEDVREGVKATLKEVPLWTTDDDTAVRAMPGLRALFEDACARYAAAKRERHALDFLDLEVAAVALLAGHDRVAAACRARFRHVMVDEAQDVSPVQARLVRLLLGEGEGRPRLFLVGDEKQSIYGFRGADVRQFRELRELVRSWGGLLLPLSASFRTHRDLVRHTNDLFDVAFAGTAVTMEPMTGRPSDPPPAPHLVLTPIGGRTQQWLAEAEAVAQEIRGILDAPPAIWDKRAGDYRPARPGDIAVLMRGLTHVHTFEQALDANGVPFATPSGGGFFTRAEVVDLGNLLRWLSEPDDDIALVGVLRSPMFVLRDDTLLALRAPGQPPLRLALADPPAAVEADERDRCRFAAETLRALQRAARTASAAELLDQALDATAVEATWAAVSGGEQCVANIRKLVRICRELAGYTLTQVVDYLVQRRDELVTREGPAVLDRPDAVQVMTIHGAKGLEFPIVFVPLAHEAPRGSGDAVRWRVGEGVSMTLDRDEDDETRPKPGFYAYLQHLDRQDDAEEHLRLFYVAATRAGDYLYVSGNNPGPNGNGWLHAAMRALDAGLLAGVESRPLVDPEEQERTRRPYPDTVAVPPAEAQVDYLPPLLERGPVIPIRASTPVTALRLGDHHQWGTGAGDGLGLVRGRIVHRAIEARALAGNAFDAAALARIVLEEVPIADEATRDALAADAQALVDRFAASDVGRAAAGGDARFEVPFAWDWDGIPVHGQIDLLYRTAQGAWCVVDFKTDRVTPGREVQAAAPYLVQIGLYARALQAATGAFPRLGLLFLRTGVFHEPSPAELDAALARAREEIDAGLRLDPGLPDYLGADED